MKRSLLTSGSETFLIHQSLSLSPILLSTFIPIYSPTNPIPLTPPAAPPLSPCLEFDFKFLTSLSCLFCHIVFSVYICPTNEGWSHWMSATKSLRCDARTRVTDSNADGCDTGEWGRTPVTNMITQEESKSSQIVPFPHLLISLPSHILR